MASSAQERLDAAGTKFVNVRTYLDYDEMLDSEDTLQAVIISSATAAHADQVIKAIKRGLHVLCEKPLSTNVEVVSINLLHC